MITITIMNKTDVRRRSLSYQLEILIVILIVMVTGSIAGQ